MAGAFTWIATITGNVVAEGMGAGGGGRIGQGGGTRGCGGGGGAYARAGGIAVVNLVSYSGNVGVKTTSAGVHETTFPGAANLFVDYGRNAGFQANAAGGLASASTGSVKFDGGTSASWSSGSLGGGGASSASRTAAGTSGSFPNGGIPVPPTDGGSGGAGGQPTGDGSIGTDPGGGGGGGGGDLNQTNPGIGTDGCIVIWNQTDWPDYATPGSRPVGGSIPLYTGGNPPAEWTNTNYTTTYAYISN